MKAKCRTPPPVSKDPQSNPFDFESICEKNCKLSATEFNDVLGAHDQILKQLLNNDTFQPQKIAAFPQEIKSDRCEKKKEVKNIRQKSPSQLNYVEAEVPPTPSTVTKKRRRIDLNEKKSEKPSAPANKRKTKPKTNHKLLSSANSAKGSNLGRLDHSLQPSDLHDSYELNTDSLASQDERNIYRSVDQGGSPRPHIFSNLHIVNSNVYFSILEGDSSKLTGPQEKTIPSRPNSGSQLQSYLVRDSKKQKSSKKPIASKNGFDGSPLSNAKRAVNRRSMKNSSQSQDLDINDAESMYLGRRKEGRDLSRSGSKLEKANYSGQLLEDVSNIKFEVSSTNRSHKGEVEQRFGNDESTLENINVSLGIQNRSYQSIAYYSNY